MGLVSGVSKKKKNGTQTVLDLKNGLFLAFLFLCECIELLLQLSAGCELETKIKRKGKDKFQLKFIKCDTAICKVKLVCSFVPFKVYKGMFESVKLDNPVSGDAASTGSA